MGGDWEAQAGGPEVISKTVISAEPLLGGRACLRPRRRHFAVSDWQRQSLVTVLLITFEPPMTSQLPHSVLFLHEWEQARFLQGW